MKKHLFFSNLISRQFLTVFAALAAALGVVFALQVVLAWTGPTSAPPGGNVALSDGDWTITGSDMYSAVAGNVGIGQPTPGAKLEVAGQIKITGGSPAPNRVLASDATGLASWQDVSAVGGVSGTGTTNYLPKWTGASSLGNSLVFDDGTNVGIGVIPTAKLHIGGTAGVDGIKFPDGNVLSSAHWNLWVQETYNASASGWSNNTIGTCGGFSMLGGYGNFAGGCVSKTFSGLPAHQSMRVRLQYYFIDSWDGESGYFQADGVTRWTKSHTLGGPQLCGGGWGEDPEYPVDAEFPHTAASVTIAVCSSLDQAATDESFGFSDLQIYTR